MGDRDNYQRGTRVYVGGLSNETKKEDLESEFEKFGKLNNVWVAFNPPGFAFVEFSNKIDAENACYNMNGTELLGGKLRVELSRNRGRGGYRGNSGGGSFGRGRGGSRGGSSGMSFNGGRGRGGPRPDGSRGGSRRGGFGGDRGFGRPGDREGNFGGGGGFGPFGNGNESFNRSNYNGGDGGPSGRFRSRSPLSAGGGGATRRY